MSAWHYVFIWGNSEILQKLWEWAKGNLTKEEINDKSLLGTEKGGTTPWHYATRMDNSEVFRKVWEWAKENLTKEEIKINCY